MSTWFFVVMSAMMRHTPVDLSFGSRSGSSRAKVAHKNRKKLRNFMFRSAGCSLLRAEGFFFGLDGLYGGLGKLQFLNF
jgi:hypothetical protein